jgi:sugar (pentulose or hexulose) kinase
MKSPPYLLALDAGTGAGRCFIIDAEGQRCFSAYREWQYVMPRDAPARGLEFDAESFWQILTQVIQEVLTANEIDPSQIAAVSTTSMREGFVLLDEAGREIFAAPNRDQRSWEEAQEIEQEYGWAIHHTSGHWPTAVFVPARLLWLRRHRPEIYARAAHLLMLNDWVAYRLCHVLGSEPTNAAETALYDIGKLRWAEDLIEHLHIPLRLFSKVRPAGTVLGEISVPVAQQTHLRAGTPVVVGGADTQCGVLAAKGINAGEAVAIAGTTTPVQVVLGEPVIDPEARTWSAPHVVPGHWVLESNCSVTGSVLRWFRGAFCQSEVVEAKRTGGNAYELMMDEAAHSPIGARGVFAMLGPTIMDAKHLHRGSAAVGGIIMTQARSLPTTQPESKADCIRAILESFAYAIRANCEQMTSITGRRIEKLGVCGGTASSSFWLSMLSDVAGIPIQVPRILEASALGTAICAGVGSGHYQDLPSGVNTLVQIRQTIEPNLTAHRQYDDYYHQWLALRQQLIHLNP